MYPFLSLVVYGFLVVIGEFKSAFATAQQQEMNTQDFCEIYGISGKWVSIFQCPASRGYVRIAQSIQLSIEETDIMVCCELKNIKSDCAPDSLNFLLTRVDQWSESTSSFVLLEKNCDDYGTQDGEPCKITEVGIQIEGTWTHGNYCKRFRGTTAKPDNSGCCKPNAISAQKCQEYTSKVTDERCMGINRSEESTFLVELFDRHREQLEHQSGILISELFVLTTGFCVSLEIGFVQFRETNQRLYPVKEGIVHPNYTHYANDIGLIKLKTKITMNTRIRPACLLTQGSQTRMVRVNKMIGFAYFSSKELWRPIAHMDSDNCTKVFPMAKPGEHFCAQRNDSIPCYFKYGSPIFIQDASAGCASVLVGIKSYGRECNYQLFTLVNAFIPWIESIVWTDG